MTLLATRTWARGLLRTHPCPTAPGGQDPPPPYQHRLWPRNLGGGVPAFLYAVLESNLAWRDRNKVSAERHLDSRGTIWHLAPGVQYVSKRYIAEVAVQLPVVQDLNGDALENDFISSLSIRMNF